MWINQPMLSKSRDASYGCQIWGMSPNAQRIIRLQKSAVRILTFSNFNSHTKPIFCDLKILSLPDLIFLSNIILIYQILNDISPIDICNIFNLHYQSSNHLTRSVSQKQLSRPMVRTTSFGLQSIQYRSILNWNSLKHALFLPHKTNNSVINKQFLFVFK